MSKSIELSVLERIKLVEFFADRRGSFNVLKILNDFVSSLALTEEEMKKIEYQEFPQDGGHFVFSWNKTKEFSRAYFLSDIVLDKLKEKFSALDKAQALTQDYYSLYEKIMS
jgi:hypothetical protein